MKRAKPAVDPLLGARVPKEMIERFDNIVETHNKKIDDGVIWTRSDVIRQALKRGADQIEKDMLDMLERRL